MQWIGGPGSGKTTIARLIGRLVAGPDFDVCRVPVNERDFGPVIANNHPAVLDNVENPPKWLPDALAGAASGVAFKARRLYTDAGVVSMKAAGIIHVTSFSGGGQRGDVIDRSLILRLRAPGERRSEATMLQRLEEMRPQMRVELDTVTAAVRERHVAGFPTHSPPEAGRLSDFAILGRVIAEVTGGPTGAALFDGGMVGLAVERLALAARADPLLHGVIAWAYSPDNLDDEGKPGLRVTVSTLLNWLSKALGGVDGFSGTARDAIRLGRLLSDLSREAAGIVEVERSFTSGRFFYRITPRITLPEGASLVG